ncbi:MAG: hypothetical protein Q9183_005421 [Haloplaca sp. 2 TL-2023]
MVVFVLDPVSWTDHRLKQHGHLSEITIHDPFLENRARVFLSGCYGSDQDSFDFDVGKGLTLLPRCRNGCFYHNECIVVAVDGACRSNGTSNAKGAYGIFWGRNSQHNRSIIIPGGPVTSQKAELRACVEALVMVRTMKNYTTAGGTGLEQVNSNEFPHVIIKTDSGYLVDGMTEHRRRWMANGYKNMQGDPLVNGEWFIRLEQETQMLEDLGIHTYFWKVPASFNKDAGKLARSVLS